MTNSYHLHARKKKKKCMFVCSLCTHFGKAFQIARPCAYDTCVRYIVSVHGIHYEQHSKKSRLSCRNRSRNGTTSRKHTRGSRSSSFRATASLRGTDATATRLVAAGGHNGLMRLFRIAIAAALRAMCSRHCPARRASST